ncbi:HesB-like selenoprotein [Hathewaya proteolytica DSM 3090]|uniref:HesB-like selenoprotein n=1 Tax=Hathewaya proteolytica DSM 3090 TaxID=1121331 RepID=A0A1M6RMF5_9CLOT|nr:HesB-like protein [Hathewaya proteolytica]SHK33616.1 HesB-like selenoprotein [Hathewaya proteolytica DSM 3090]
MAFVNISDGAYKEFQQVLIDNNIETKVVRIVISGMGCSGPAFGLVLDEQKENDNAVVVNDTTFLVDKDINEEFGELTIKSGEENGYGGLSIEPEIAPEGGCCGNCSHCH